MTTFVVRRLAKCGDLAQVFQKALKTIMGRERMGWSPEKSSKLVGDDDKYPHSNAMQVPVLHRLNTDLLQK